MLLLRLRLGGCPAPKAISPMWRRVFFSLPSGEESRALQCLPLKWEQGPTFRSTVGRAPKGLGSQCWPRPSRLSRLVAESPTGESAPIFSNRYRTFDSLQHLLSTESVPFDSSPPSLAVSARGLRRPSTAWGGQSCKKARKVTDCKVVGVLLRVGRSLGTGRERRVPHLPPVDLRYGWFTA